MRTRPNARDLIEIAAKEFRDDLMPDLPQAKRYAALMVASALANAGRDLAAGSAPLEAELARLAVIYPNAETRPADLETQLARFNRQLAADIRKGRFAADRGTREQVRMHLVQTAIERVRETNPKYLEREGLA